MHVPRIFAMPYPLTRSFNREMSFRFLDIIYFRRALSNFLKIVTNSAFYIIRVTAPRHLAQFLRKYCCNNDPTVLHLTDYLFLSHPLS